MLVKGANGIQFNAWWFYKGKRIGENRSKYTYAIEATVGAKEIWVGLDMIFMRSFISYTGMSHNFNALSVGHICVIL